MILFCDTSALIKLYIVELGSEELKARVLEAEAVAVCRIAWAEAHAACIIQTSTGSAGRHVGHRAG